MTRTPYKQRSEPQREDALLHASGGFLFSVAPKSSKRKCKGRWEKTRRLREPGRGANPTSHSPPFRAKLLESAVLTHWLHVPALGTPAPLAHHPTPQLLPRSPGECRGMSSRPRGSPWSARGPGPSLRGARGQPTQRTPRIPAPPGASQQPRSVPETPAGPQAGIGSHLRPCSLTSTLGSISPHPPHCEARCQFPHLFLESDLEGSWCGGARLNSGSSRPLPAPVLSPGHGHTEHLRWRAGRRGSRSSACGHMTPACTSVTPSWRCVLTRPSQVP